VLRVYVAYEDSIVLYRVTHHVRVRIAGSILCQLLQRMEVNVYLLLCKQTVVQIKREQVVYTQTSQLALAMIRDSIEASNLADVRFKQWSSVNELSYVAHTCTAGCC
jgi:hypothetical protein